MKKYFLIFVFCPISFLFAQNEKLITKINLSSVQEKLRNATKEISVIVAKKQSDERGILLDLPMADGSYMSFKVIESPLMSDELAQRFPEIKTYRAFGSSDKEANGLFTVAPSGVYGLFFTEKGNVIIVPKDISQNEHEVFYQNDLLTDGKCEVGEEHINTLEKNLKAKAIQSYSNGATLRTYRMSILTTGEFYTSNGGTLVVAQAAVVSIVNSLKAVYEKEVSVSFTLVNTKIYTDAATDPFNGSDALKAAETFGALATSDPANFALANYDIGHVLHGTSGGGVAYLNGPCRNNNLNGNPSPIKAGAWSGSNPSSFSTFIHEVGHQFSAGHTFNSINAGCAGNIMTGSAFEPGSGSTYMSYWGNCSPDNISGAVVRTYFHTNSLESIINYSINTGTCSVNTATGNTAPVVSANPNSISLIIPKGTPFALNGSGSDANGATVLFNWEQYNLGTTRGGADESQNSTDSPIFRTFAPSSTGNLRMFPTLSTILGGSISNNDEALPQVARTITMRLTGRVDNVAGGGVHCASINVVVDNSGPFLLTSQNTSTLWIVNKTVNITWSINGTNVSPINCLNVKISFSTDGGQTFPTILTASTPNDGSHSITIPNLPTTQGRIKVEAIGYVFFDINNVNIVITSTCSPEISSISPSFTITEAIGSANLNLGLISLGTSFTSISGTVSNTDISGTLAGNNNGSCINYGNSTRYDVYSFKVATIGNYILTLSGNPFGILFNVYNGTFNASSMCNNWLGSSYNAFTNSLGNSVTLNNLPVGNYQLIVSSFSPSLPSSLPAAYTVSFNQNVYNPVPSIGSLYAYTYVIKNNTSGNITGFTENSDLTNISTYPAGSYTVYGLSYQSGYDLSAHIGTAFSTFEGLLAANTICGILSSNTKTVTINPNCLNTLNLSSTTNAGVQQANQTITSTQIINSGINVTYRANNSIILSPQTGSGFSAVSGSVFKAEIGGCN